MKVGLSCIEKKSFDASKFFLIFFYNTGFFRANTKSQSEINSEKLCVKLSGIKKNRPDKISGRFSICEVSKLFCKSISYITCLSISKINR